MAEPLQISFASLSAATSGAAMVLAGDELALGTAARGLDERSKGALLKAARAADFKGKAKTSVEVLAPAGLEAQRVVIAGVAGVKSELDRLQLGGYAFAQLSARKGETATLIADPADTGDVSADAFAADLALGALLRSYTFKKYVTRSAEENGGEGGAQRSAQARDSLRQAGRGKQSVPVPQGGRRRRIPRARPRQRARQHAGA